MDLSTVVSFLLAPIADMHWCIGFDTVTSNGSRDSRAVNCDLTRTLDPGPYPAVAVRFSCLFHVFHLSFGSKS